MKKQLFFIAAAALTLAACSLDETTSVNPGDQISMRAVATRGDITTTANLSEFYVTAFDLDYSTAYFTDVKFTRSDEATSTYNSDIPYYWPGDNRTLGFYVYAPSATDLGCTAWEWDPTKTNNQILADFSPADEIGDQKDPVYKYVEGDGETNKDGVDVTLTHLLSLITIKAKCDTTKSNLRVKVMGARIGYCVNKATFTIGSGNTGWWDRDDTSKAEYDSVYVASASNANGDTFEAQVVADSARVLAADAQYILGSETSGAMLLPQSLTAWVPYENGAISDGTNSAEGAYLAVYVDINQVASEDANGENRTYSNAYPAVDGYAWVAIPIDTQWQRNKKYIYTLDFSKGAGYADPTSSSTTNGVYDAGTPIFGEEIEFVNVTVGSWGVNDAFNGVGGDGEVDMDVNI